MFAARSPTRAPRHSRTPDARPAGLDQIGIQAELQDGAAFGLAGELCVDHFVGPWPKVARRVHASQDVRAARPFIGPERSLDDDLVTTGHGVAGPRHSVVIDADAFDHGYLEACRPEVIHKPLFVPRAALP